jgi:uncharacterized membrane protein YdjX (TVP38/TMEM64 family)
VIRDPLLRRHVLFAAILVALVAMLWLSAALQAAFVDALQFSKDHIERYPVASRAAFIVLAACSALLALFSSVALVPIAVHAWGQGETLVLLAAGWFAGGTLAYFIGSRVGRRAAEYFVAAPKLERYGRLLSAMSMVEVMLLKLALPSEMTSLALGVIRYPVHKLVLVLLASELPFAVWAVYLSTALLEDRRLVLLLVLLAGLAAAGVAGRGLLAAATLKV